MHETTGEMIMPYVWVLGLTTLLLQMSNCVLALRNGVMLGRKSKDGKLFVPSYVFRSNDTRLAKQHLQTVLQNDQPRFFKYQNLVCLVRVRVCKVVYFGYVVANDVLASLSTYLQI